MAFDLGAEYKIDDNWKVSMSLLDLGWIGFKNNFVASTDGEHMVETDKYLFNLKDDTYHSFDNEKERLAEGISQLYELKDKGNTGSRSRALGATWTWGAEYKTKFYDKLTFAFLNTTRIQGKYSWTDFRFSANVAPTKAFSATANLAFTTFGTSFGWLINVHPNGFNFFLGMDHTWQTGKTGSSTLRTLKYKPRFQLPILTDSETKERLFNLQYVRTLSPYRQGSYCCLYRPRADESFLFRSSE